MADAPVRDFASTTTGEWATNNGDFYGVAGRDATMQGARIRIGMILGEVYLDEEIGVDYFEVILVKDPDELLVRAEVEQQVLATPDITAVTGTQLEEDPVTREGILSLTYDDVYSTEPATVQVSTP